MFQIVSTLMEEVPACALRMRELRGEQPRVQLMDNPWDHGEDCVAKCDCLDSDRTGAYVHCLIPKTDLTDLTPRDNADVSVDMATGFTFNNDCGYLGVGRAGSIPFVSEKPGAYGRLLLAVYVRWRTGLLISSDWLRPVTRGAWRAVLPVSWLTSKESSIQPSVMILGASTMHGTLPSSLSLTMARSAEETVIAGGKSIRSVSSSIDPSDLSQVDVTSAPLISVPSQVESKTVEIDSSCVIHPFYIHKMDSGPVRLMTIIAHAFNYRVAVLRDGVRSAVRVGRSRKAEKCFLTDVNISWGQQVAVMFQIVSTLMEEVPAFALRMRELRGEQPRVQLMDNPWGHGEDCVAKCDCLDSDRTGAYVHCLIPKTDLTDLTPRDNADVSVDIATGFTFNNDCGYLGVGRAGSIPFVSEKPGAYGRLLLAVYVRWRTGLLISSDWLRPVTRGAWRAVLPDRVEEPNPVHGPGESKLTRHLAI